MQVNLRQYSTCICRRNLGMLQSHRFISSCGFHSLEVPTALSAMVQRYQIMVLISYHHAFKCARSHDR